MTRMVFVIFIFAVVPLAHAQSEWTLEHCLQTATGNSNRLDAGRWSRTEAKSAADAMRTESLPNFSLNGNYGYTSETMKLNVASPVPGVPGSSIEFGDGNVYDMNANAHIPIYSGGSVKARNRASELGYKATVFETLTDSLNFLRDVRESFYLASAAISNLNSVRQLSERLERHVKDVESAKNAGLASEESRVSALSRLRQAQSQVILREAIARNAKLRLGEIIGLTGVEIAPADSSEFLPLIHAADESATADSRTEWRAFELRVKQGEQGLRSARGRWLPSLGGNLAYHYAKPGVNTLKNEWMDYYTIGATASWMLWDFGSRDYSILSARAVHNRLLSQRKDLYSHLDLQIRTAESTCNNARPACTMMAERADLERQRLAFVEGRWKAGIATETEYLDAQDDMTQAEFEYISATVNLRLAENALLRSYGR